MVIWEAPHLIMTGKICALTNKYGKWKNKITSKLSRVHQLNYIVLIGSLGHADLPIQPILVLSILEYSGEVFSELMSCLGNTSCKIMKTASSQG